MANKAINIFDDDNFSTGGGIFPDGPARFESVRYTTYDFGTPGNDQAVCQAMATPLNADGTDNGEAKPIRWAITTKDGKDDVVLVNPVKGEKGCFSGLQISESNKYGKLFGGADFGVFRNSLKAAAKLSDGILDMEEVGADITSLDGTLVTIGKHTETRKPKLSDDDKSEAKAAKDKKDWTTVIVTEILDPKKFGKGGKSTKKAVKEEEEEEKPVKKGSKSKAAELSDDPDDIVSAYLDSELTDDQEGENPLNIKIGVSAWAKKQGKDEDVSRAAQSHLKDNLGAFLKAKGWSVGTSGNTKGLLVKE